MPITGRHVHVDPADLEPESEGQSSNKSRIIWTFADQALSSLSNFALSIVVAREVSEDDFGSFSLMLVTFTFLIGLGRAAIGDPYVIRFTDADRHTRRRASRQATGTAISFGVITGVICAIAAAALFFAMGDRHGALAILGLGIAMPGLMLQETWRSAFFADGRPRTATINDAARTAIQFGLLAILLASPNPSVFLITLAWGAGALAAALIGIVQTRVAPDPFEAMAWYRETRDINLKMAADFSFNQGATTLVSYVLTAVVGKIAIGAIRAAQTLLGPLNLLFSGISSFGLPLLTRTAMSGRSLIKQSLLLSGMIGGVAGSWVLILLVVPTSIGEQFLGASWGNARAVMLPMGIITVTVGFVLGASLGLKALRRADQMLRVTFVQAPLMLGLGSLGGWLWSAEGAAWGMATAQVIGFVACWVIFIQADRLPRPWIDEENDDSGPGPRDQGPGRRDDGYGRDERYDRHDGGFWSQDEQDRWAREEPEGLYSGQQAEEPWERDDRQRRDQQRRPDPRGQYEERGSQAEGWYDPTGPTVAVRQGKPAGPDSGGVGYDPHDPTVAVRKDRKSPSDSKYRAPWEDESAPQPKQGGRGEADPGRGGYDERGRNEAGYDRGRGEAGSDRRGQGEAGYSERGQGEAGYDEPGRGGYGERDRGRQAGYDDPDQGQGRYDARGQGEAGSGRRSQGGSGYDDRDQEHAAYSERGRGRAANDESGQSVSGARERGRGERGQSQAGYAEPDSDRSTGYDERTPDRGAPVDQSRRRRSRSASAQTDREDAGYDRDGYDDAGYDQAGYNGAGYDQAGYNGAGYDRAGYNDAGYNDAGYDKGGYNKGGYDRAGYDEGGYNQAGYDKGGYNEAGYDKGGYSEAGYDKGGFDQAGYNKAGYNQAGYDQAGYNKAGYNQAGYDQGGYNQAGYDQSGYNKGGYDQGGYNRAGYDDAGYDRDGFDQGGFDRDGHGKAGYERNGQGDAGYDRGGQGDAGYDRGGQGDAGYDREGQSDARYGRGGQSSTGGYERGSDAGSRQERGSRSSRQAYDERDQDPWPFPDTSRRGR